MADTVDNDIWVEVTTLAPSAHEQVYEQVQAAFGITPEMIELLGAEDRHYWIGLIEAAAKFVPADHDGLATGEGISSSDLHDLHARANSADDPILFLQRFSDFSLEKVSRLAMQRPDIVEPGAIYPIVCEAFTNDMSYQRSGQLIAKLYHR